MFTHPIPEFGPSEDLVLRLLRDYFYGDPMALSRPPGAGRHDPEIVTLLPQDQVFPTILIRRDKRSGSQNIRVENQRYMQTMVATFETFTQGLEADRDGALLQESVRHALQRAVDRQDGYPDLGYLNHMNLWSQAARVSDYATSTGVVQYASLPNGVVRYESIYQFIVRPVERGMTDNPFLR